MKPVTSDKILPLFFPEHEGMIAGKLQNSPQDTTSLLFSNDLLL